MIIHNGYLGWSGIGPTKDNAPLIVDPNGMKPRKFARQRFQPVSGRDRHIPQPPGPVQLNKFAQGNAGNRIETPASLLSVKLLRVVIAK